MNRSTALSPDGRQVAFARWDGTARGLYLIGVDGSGERMIFGDQQLKAPAWSADGAHIAFYRQHGRREAELVCYPGFGCFTIPEDPYWRLGIVDVASGEFRDLLSDLHSRSPDFFPAGDRVVYVGDQGLQTTAVDRDEQGVLAKELKLSSPDVSPDGRRIVYMQYVHDHWDLFVANADGANPVALTRIGAFDPRPVNNVAPAWSPDGSSIVFLSDRESGRWRLYVMAADGSQVRLVPGEELAALQFHYDHVDEQVVDWGP